MVKTRTLSYSEIDTALTCWAKWDFQYGGHLAGSTLKNRVVPTILSRGSAWGAAMQAYHGGAERDVVMFHVRNALRKDEIKAEANRVVLPERLAWEIQAEVMALFDHYAFRHPGRYEGLQKIEHHLEVPIPSRSGKGLSTRYAFEAYLDWSAFDPLPECRGWWLLETKLRGELHSMHVLERSNQLKWYAWSWWQETGLMPAGVIIDTWLTEVPNTPRMIKAKRKGDGNANGQVLSEAKDQVTTVELYLEACARENTVPLPELIQHFKQRVWGQRAIIGFTEAELVRAGRELVSAARLIRDLDSGLLLPIRHATPRTCNACRFKGICTHPEDKFAIEGDFVRGVPKRLLPPREKEVAHGG